MSEFEEWKPKRLSEEQEKRILGEDAVKVKSILESIADAAPGITRPLNDKERADRDRIRTDRAEYDEWLKKSPIAKDALLNIRIEDKKKKHGYGAGASQEERTRVDNELWQTFRAEKGFRDAVNLQDLDGLQGRADSLLRKSVGGKSNSDSAGGPVSLFGHRGLGPVAAQNDETVQDSNRLYGKAESLYNDLSDIVSYAREFKQRGGYASSAKEFASGFRDAITKLRTIDLGLTDLFESSAYKKVVDKKLRGEKLSDREEAVLELDQLYKDVSSMLTPSRGYKAGANTAQSVPFMAEFAFSPVSGAGKAVAKAVGKSIIKSGGKAAAKGLTKSAARVISTKGGELALKTMADVFVTAPAMSATTGMPRVLAEANRRIIEDGDTPLSATLKAGTASWIEYMSEGLGGAVDVGLSKAGRLMFGNGMEKLAATAVGRKLSALGKSSYAGAIRRMKGAANVQSFLGENIEEHIGNVVNHFTVGDVTKEDLLNLDTYLETAIPIAVTQAVFGISSVGGYSWQVGRVSRVAKKAETALGQFMPPEEQAKLRERMDGMPLDAVAGLVKRQIQKAVENERQAAQTEDESLAAVYKQDAKKARAAAAYVYAHTQKSILIGAKRQVDEEKAQAFTQERDRIKEEYIAAMPAAENGSYRIARLNGEGGEAVQVMTDVSTYEVEERGDMITRFRSPDNTVFVKHADGSTEQLRVDQLLFDKELQWVDNVDETATNLANMDASKFFEELEAEREAEFEAAQVETEKEGLRIENGEMAMMSQEDGSLVPVTIADTSMIEDGMVGIVMQDDSMGVVPVDSLSAYEADAEGVSGEGVTSRDISAEDYSAEERELMNEAYPTPLSKKQAQEYDDQLAEENAHGVSFDELELSDAISYLQERVPEDAIEEFVDQEMREAKRALTSAKRAKVRGKTVDERAKSFSERKDRIRIAEARVKRWANIKEGISSVSMFDEHDASTSVSDQLAESTQSNSNKELDMRPTNAVELAAYLLVGRRRIRLIYKDFIKHTGYSHSEARRLFGIFASKEKGGISFERFGEEIVWANDELAASGEINGNLIDADDAMAGVNAALELFHSVRSRGDLYRLLREGAEMRSAEEDKALYDAEAEFIYEAYHMSVEEYEAWLDQMKEKALSLSLQEYEELQDQIAEEYDKQRTQEDGGRRAEPLSVNEQRGEDRISERSSDVLHGERAGDRRGNSEVENVGRVVESAGAESGSAQDAGNVKNNFFAEDGISERISQASDGAQDGESGEVVKEPHFSQGGFESSVRDAQAHKGLEVAASVSDQIAEEREKVDPNPTEAQKSNARFRETIDAAKERQAKEIEPGWFDRVLSEQQLPDERTDSKVKGIPEDFVAGEKDESVVLTGVYHANGRVYASDGFALICEEKKYPKKDEGKTLSKKEGEIKGKYPNIEGVIPKGIDYVSFDADELVSFVERVETAVHAEWNKKDENGKRLSTYKKVRSKTAVVVRVNGSDLSVRFDQLDRVAKAASRLKLGQVGVTDRNVIHMTDGTNHLVLASYMSEDAFKSNHPDFAVFAHQLTDDTEDVRYRAVFHGSPHTFESFDHSKMGTGEGEQAYGWGTYVTEVDGIARSYATELANRIVHVSEDSRLSPDEVDHIRFMVKNGATSVQQLIDSSESRLKILKDTNLAEVSEGFADSTRLMIERYENILPALKSGEVSISFDGRNLYEVDIPDDGFRSYIKWDEILPEEDSEHIWDAIKSDLEGKDVDIEEIEFPIVRGTGEQVYESLASYLGSPEAASKFLSEYGYIGISYPAEHTMGGRKDGARNYVIFKEEDAKIISHERFRFLGENGAAALDRYEEAERRLNNLVVAREMEDAGTDELAIKRATGWERGADGLWRYEVSDFDLAIIDETFDKSLGQHGVSLAEFVGKDSSLFVSYPLMKYINVKRRDLGDRINGSFQRVARAGFIEINRNLPIADAEATLVHEVQHAIQHEEGFENGMHSGSSDYRKNAGEVEARNAARRIDLTDDLRVMLGKYTEDVSRADQIFLSNSERGLQELVSSIDNHNTQKMKPITAWDELVSRSPRLQLQQKIREEVSSLSAQLGVPVNFVFSRDLKGKKAQAKGWYDGKTGEVFIVLDKNVDVEDAVATVMHEVVAHKGLRDMLGRAEHDALMDEVFNVIPEDVISELKGFYWDDTKSEAHNRRVLADEYVALLAETYQSPSVIERIAAAVRAAFRRLGIAIKMNDGDIMYMLYLSKNRLTNRDSSMAVIDKTDRLQMAKVFAEEYDKIMFRMPIEDVENNLYDGKSAEVGEYLRAKLNTRWYRWTEAHQDAMRSWKLLIDKLKDVKESENVYMMENLMGSRCADKVKRFEDEKMKPLEVSIRKIKKVVKLSDDGLSLYLMAKHAPERNAYMRMKAIEELEEDRVGPLKDVSEEDYQREMDRIHNKDYAGEKAIEKELKTLGYDSLQSYIDHVESVAGAELTNTLWERLRSATKYSIREWYDCGMMSRESYNEMSNRYEWYVPLRGHKEEVAHDIFKYYKAEVDPRFSDPNERAQGRKSVADNPLPFIRQMAHSAVIAGGKNLVKMSAYRLASSHENDTLFIGTQYYEVRKDSDGNIVEHIPIYPEIEAGDSEEAMKEKMKAFHEKTGKGLRNGSIMKEAKGVRDMKLFATDQEVREHICTLKINGRSFYLIAPMHPELTQSITGRNKAVAEDPIIRKVAAVTNFMAKNYTSRSPNFMVGNFSRDVWWSIGSLFTREGGRYLALYMKNIPLAFKELFKGRKNSAILDEFYRSGAATGFVTINKESRYKKDAERRSSDAIKHKVRRGFIRTVNMFEDVNAVSENVTRLAVFMTSRQAGRSLSRSAYDAKEASVNFNRKGSGKMGAVYMKSFFAFYNAGIQGLDAYSKLWSANWKKTAFLHGMALLFGSYPYIVAALMGDDDTRKKYFALPEYVRRNNLVIPIGGDNFLKVPLPIEARAFHSLGDIFGGLFRGEIDGKQAAISTLSSMMDMFPINFFDAHGGIEKGAKLYELGDHAGAMAATFGGVVPTAFRPLTEVVANMNYTGGRIYYEADWNAHLPAYRKAGYFTNKHLVNVAKWLNNSTGGDSVIPGRLNVNPSIAEHYLMGYIGGVLTFVNQSVRTIDSFFSDGEMNWGQAPVINRFLITDKRIIQKKIDRDFRDVSDDMKIIQKREIGYKKVMKEGTWVEQENASIKLQDMYEDGSLDLSEYYKNVSEYIKAMRNEMDGMDDAGKKLQMEKEITDIKADFLEYKKSIDDGREEEKGKTA